MGIRIWGAGLPSIMSLRDIHTPVLLDRCLELLAPSLERDGAVFVDATLGMGGHSEAFLERFRPRKDRKMPPREARSA